MIEAIAILSVVVLGLLIILLFLTYDFKEYKIYQKEINSETNQLLDDIKYKIANHDTILNRKKNKKGKQ